MSSLELIDQFLEEKEKNKNNEKISFEIYETEFFWKIEAVGKGIIQANPEFVIRNNFVKIE